MLRRISYSYWICQLAGWGALLAFFCWLPPHEVGRSILTTASGFLVSHFLREVLRRYRWMEKKPKRWVIRVCLAVVVASLVGALILWAALQIFEYHLPPVFIMVSSFSVLIMDWTCVYCSFKYRRLARRNDSREQMLCMRLREMRKGADELELDAEAIVDRLQRIEGMIEADPARSREEITAFSKLLRTGYIAEK
ncbi:hypothetical protein [Puia sp.]|uniref:hypothetical protein n=1 Tax=Puia sp. TaxID=2045100 RepID=UPI002F42161D